MATHCKSCQATIPDGAKFCPQCGNPTPTSQSGSARPMTAAKDTVRAQGHGLRDMLIIIGALAVVTALYFVLRAPQTPPQPPSAESQTPAGQPQTGSTMGGGGMMGAALTNLPTDYNSLVQTGNREMDSGNFPVAAEAYRRALAIDSTSSDVRTDYGACLHGMGMPDRAIEEFKHVLARDPRHSIAHFNLGIVYSQINQMDSAKAYWKKYLEMEPNGQASAAAREYLKNLGG